MGKLFNINKTEWENHSLIHNTIDKWLFYAEGYKIASELIEKELIKTLKDRDSLIYPLMYLNRHYLELKLKEIIVEGNYILDNKHFMPKGGHDLMTLWIESQRVLVKVWRGEYDKPSVRISNKIKEFHKADLKSDGFRYPVNKEGEDNLIEFQRIDFKSFINEFSEVKEYMEEITDGLYYLKDEKDSI
ncbi:hypothetical protein D1816_23800 [Aquimarina sp. AD10]|uniref:hypothetical protein n=1 Tax=Aquimarina sp. AD10 TaxID=1714849 RepID=UPI000E4B8076|nr:hypothetical protein [Aquimarina sp. AD10]AXT63242.1 hypothetical protein D1816_23800 [Aquimarina sp. AD10]RKN00745.1 hypothetical protein D7033_07895 [Aquimarina sp. AD10]